VIVDGLTWLHIGNYLGPLRRNVQRRWTYPTFEPPPLHICYQEERIAYSKVVGVGEGVEEERRDEMSEEEGEFNATSPRRVLIARSLTTRNLIRGIG
jgi:hypothetical protein